VSKPLTAQAVAKIKASGALPREVADASAPGLYLVIYPSGKKSWALRFRRPDRRTAKLVLGTVNLIGDAKRDPDPVVGGHLTLAAARRLTAALKHQIAMGKDPAAIYQAERRSIALSAADSFAVAACDFISQYAKKHTRRWQEQARLLGLRETNEGIEPIASGLAMRWRDKPLSEIDADTVFRLVEEVRHKGVPGLERRSAAASESRSRAMHAVLSKMLNWLTQKRRIAVSPMAALKRPPPSRARDRVLSDQEIIAFWRSADEATPPFGALLKLLLLTGARLNEVARMEVAELSDDGATWTIPGSRTKNRRTHVMPLSPLARAILTGVKRMPECRFVFSTNQQTPVSGFSKTKRRLDDKMKDVAAWRLHDLRRTCATGMAEIGVPPHIVELCLNHVSGARAGVAGTYNRSVQMAERRAALERWADHVAGLVGNSEAHHDSR
jgi:integrase